MLNAYNRRTVFADSGAVAAGAIVTFRNEQTGVLAPLYNDQAGTSLIGTAVTSGSQGEVEVFLAPGFYRRVTTIGGVTVDDVRWEPVVGSSGVQDASLSGLMLINLPAPVEEGVVTVDPLGIVSVKPMSEIGGGGADVLGETALRAADYTLDGTLHNVFRETSGDVVVTVPAEISSDLSLSGSRVYMHHIQHLGGGTLTVDPAEGVSVFPPAGGSLTLSNPGQVITISKSTVSADTWFVYGRTDAAGETPPTPTAFSNIMFFGASIMLDANDRPADFIAMMDNAGIDVSTTSATYANDGDTSAQYLSKLPAALSAAPAGALFFIHGSTNDVTQAGPYPGGATTLDTNMREVIETVQAAGHSVVYGRLSYYSTLNPTGPYNVNVVDAIVEDLTPEYYRNGAPTFDWYSLAQANPDYLSDGRHPTPWGAQFFRAHMAQVLINRYYNKYATSAAEVAGKTVVVSFGSQVADFNGINAAIASFTTGSNTDGYASSVAVCRATDGTLLHGLEVRAENTGSVNYAGRGNSGVTTASLANHVLLSESIFKGSQTVKIRIFGVPSGASGTLKITSSNINTGRTAVFTFDGVSVSLDPSAGTPSTVASWAFTGDGLPLEITWTNDTGVSFSYCNGLSLEFAA